MANQSLTNSKVDLLSTQLIDFHGRRITNAAPSQSPTDYVIRSELIAAINDNTKSITDKTTSTGISSRVYSLEVSGILGSLSNAAPNLYINDDGIASLVRADVQNYSIGNPIQITIYMGTTSWMTLTILAGSLSIIATQTQLAGASQVVSGQFWKLDINSVGGTYPGSDLVVTIVV